MTRLTNYENDSESISAVVLENYSATRYYELLILKKAIKLESLGMKHSSGRSARVVACQLLNLTKSTRAPKVLESLEELISKYEANLTIEPTPQGNQDAT